MTYTLRSAAASPFARKVRIAAAICGLADEVEIENPDPDGNQAPVSDVNPLGKIPALIDASGKSLYDSRVIVEFLDFKSTP